METKRIVAICFLTTGLFLSACGPGQLFGPTAMPTIPTRTPTPRPTNAPTRTPTPIPTNTPTRTAPLIPTPGILLPASSLDLFLYDDFSDPSSGWNKSRSAPTDIGFFRTEYEDGHLVIANAKPGHTIWSKRNLSLTDFIFEVDATQVEVEAEGAENQLFSFFGVIFRYEDNANFYLFGINGLQQYIASKIEAGSWKPFNVGDGAFRDLGSSTHINIGGDTNKIQIVVEGSDFSFYVNDVHLADVTDSSFPEGDIALVVMCDTLAVVHFDNARLWLWR